MMNALNILPSYTEYFHLTSATIALNSGIVWIGAIVGSIALAKVPDIIGRKPSIFYAALIAILGSGIQAASQNIAMFLVARFILGLGIGGTYVAVPLLIAETLPTKYRSLGLGAFTDLYYVGGLLSAGEGSSHIALHISLERKLTSILEGVTYGTSQMASTWSWRLPSLLQILLTFISLITLPWVPESPRFLVRVGKKDEALLAVAQTCTDSDPSDPSAQAEFLQICQSLEQEKEIKQPSLKQIATTPSLRKRMMVVFTVAAFSMLTGSNLFSYYLGTALTNAGITDSTLQLEINIILNSFCLVVSLVGTLLANRLGRKNLALLSTAGCTLFLFCIGALTKEFGDSTNTTAIYATVAMIFLAQGSYSFGWTPLAVMYPPEILNYPIRSVGMAWFVTWQNLILLVPIFAFPIAMERIGWITYLVNGGFDVFVLLVVALYWVETKNLSLEEVSRRFDPQGDFGEVAGVADVGVVKGVMVEKRSVRADERECAV
jgi:MFS family permease